MIKRIVTTIAVGSKYYLYLAENLLKSFILWNSQNEISFLLITDNDQYFDKYKNSAKINIKKIVLNEDQKSFTSKFHLYDYAQGEENIFIDCDCLIYQDLEKVFNAFENKNFSALGNNIYTGEFFCDVEKTCKLFKINSMPKFVGAVYYFKRNILANVIFDKAKELKNNYDKLGFVRLRGKENEEPLFAVAMAITGETPLPNDGSIKADLMYYKQVTSNVLSGKALVTDPITHITGGEEIPGTANPAILHFNGSFSDSYQYKFEVFRLNNQHINIALVNFFAWLIYSLPYHFKATVKNCLRPIYKLIFGHRSVGKSARV